LFFKKIRITSLILIIFLFQLRISNEDHSASTTLALKTDVSWGTQIEAAEKKNLYVIGHRNGMPGFVEEPGDKYQPGMGKSG